MISFSSTFSDICTVLSESHLSLLKRRPLFFLRPFFRRLSFQPANNPNFSSFKPVPIFRILSKPRYPGLNRVFEMKSHQSRKKQKQNLTKAELLPLMQSKIAFGFLQSDRPAVSNLVYNQPNIVLRSFVAEIQLTGYIFSILYLCSFFSLLVNNLFYFILLLQSISVTHKDHLQY